MIRKVTVVDYGIGNLYSVVRALEVSGATVTLGTQPKEIVHADRLVLPGVGAFSSGIAGLRERGLLDPIRLYASTGRPLLGICLGMQLLASRSFEFGEHEGLNLIPGSVVPLPTASVEGVPVKIPRIGWAALSKPEDAEWGSSILSGVKEGDSVYLVHSFMYKPSSEDTLLATSTFEGHDVCTVIRKDGMTGCQFHPEKSGPIGLRILESFLRM